MAEEYFSRLRRVADRRVTEAQESTYLSIP